MNKLTKDLKLLEKQLTPSGVPFEEDYITSEGVFIHLYPTSKHSIEDVKKAKWWLCNQLDVIGFRTIRKS